MGYGGVVRVCLVAYPAPWGVPLEVALLQRAALTFARILEAQKISSTDVAVGMKDVECQGQCASISMSFE